MRCFTKEETKEIEEKNKKYAGCIVAEKTLSSVETLVSSAARAIFAQDDITAKNDLLQQCRKKFPAYEGYKNHKVDCVEVPAEWIRKVK